MSKAKFEIVSDCEGCQAIADGRALFEFVEARAIREGLCPHRVARALRECTAIWYAIAVGALGPERGTAADSLERFVAETEASLRHQVRDGAPSFEVAPHVH